MDKELIDLQKNAKATCAIISNDDYKNLFPGFSISANVSDRFLISISKSDLSKKIEEKSKQSKICYLVIKNIDEVSVQKQNRFVSLVKDREMYGCILPSNCIIVFTLSNIELINKVSSDLLHFSVIAI